MRPNSKKLHIKDGVLLFTQAQVTDKYFSSQLSHVSKVPPFKMYEFLYFHTGRRLALGRSSSRRNEEQRRTTRDLEMTLQIRSTTKTNNKITDPQNSISSVKRSASTYEEPIQRQNIPMLDQSHPCI